MQMVINWGNKCISTTFFVYHMLINDKLILHKPFKTYYDYLFRVLTAKCIDIVVYDKNSDSQCILLLFVYGLLSNKMFHMPFSSPARSV